MKKVLPPGPHLQIPFSHAIEEVSVKENVTRLPTNRIDLRDKTQQDVNQKLRGGLFRVDRSIGTGSDHGEISLAEIKVTICSPGRSLMLSMLKTWLHLLVAMGSEERPKERKMTDIGIATI